MEMFFTQNNFEGKNKSSDKTTINKNSDGTKKNSEEGEYIDYEEKK